MNYYEAIRATALRNVLKPDTEYYLRRIMRWYSKTFHTPLQEVYDIPIEYILKEYYEERYEGMDEEERDIELSVLIETDEQRKEREAIEDIEKASEHELMEMARKTNESKLEDKSKKIAELAKPRPKQVTNKLPEQFSKLSNSIKEVAESIKEEMRTDPENLPPDIDMKFESDEDFERMLNQDSNLLSVTDKKP